MTIMVPAGVGDEQSAASLGVLEEIAAASVARGIRAYEPTWIDTPLFSGLLAAGVAMGDLRFTRFAGEWLLSHLERPIAYGARGGPGFWPSRDAQETTCIAVSDYCGSWGSGLVALQLYRATGDPRFRTAGLEIAEYVFERGPRILGGAMEHYAGNGRLWVDTLYYCAPLLALAGSVAGDSAFADEAARQCLLHARYLQDPRTGCFFHNYRADEGQAEPGYWGRGNGWIAMSLVDVLAELPARHPDRPRLLGVLGRQLAGLVERQHRTGLWRVVLDHPDAYLETSGSAMIGYGLAQAARLVSGSDAGRFRGAARRAWDGLATYVRRRDGTVALMGAQAPSGGGDWERHKTAAVGEQPYATGPFLMLGALLANATTPAQEERP